MSDWHGKIALDTILLLQFPMDELVSLAFSESTADRTEVSESVSRVVGTKYNSNDILPYGTTSSISIE